MMGRKKQMLKKVISLTLSFIMAIPVGITVNAYGSSKVLSNYDVSFQITEQSLPSGSWQGDVSFPDWAGYVDDTLAMNSLYSFTGFRDQGEIYVSVKDGVKSFRMFVNNAEVDTEAIKSGQTYKVNISNASVDGTNTVQITNIVPSDIDKAVNIKIPYPIVIDGKPSDVGMDESTIDMIGDIINAEVKYGFSGAQLAVIKDGKLVVNESWGSANGYRVTDNSIIERIHSGDEDYIPVTKDTLFDLASNTKMYSVNYALQYLLSQENPAISIDDKITKFFPEFNQQETDSERDREWKSQLTIRNILMHQGGFPADPQYHNNKFNQADPNTGNPLFSQDRDKTLKMVLATPLNYQPGTKTVYSDVDYMLLCFIIEKVTDTKLDDFLADNIYNPLGLNKITFNPLKNGFTPNDCAATELMGNTRDGLIEFDNIRKYTIQGEVHDEKAFYSMEGISGHAGLFSNAEDLAKLANVMLSGGYGNTKLFNKNIIDEFIKPKGSSNTDSSWGLGWYREGSNTRINYFSTASSSNTIGHQGWTGTLTVIDPEDNLVIVLLTNKKNSPVLDNSIAANDFYSDNMVLGALGSIVGYVYESYMSEPDATDTSLYQFARERAYLMRTHKNAYDEAPHMNDSFALADAVITNAEKKQTEITKKYAETIVNELFELTNLYIAKEENKNNAQKWLGEFKSRIENIDAKAENNNTKKLTVSAIGALPSGAGSQVKLDYPSQVNQTSTSYGYSNSIFMFKGYEGQGEIYLDVKHADISGLRIFINGIEAATDPIFNEDGTAEKGYYKIDISSAAVNDKNLIQVTGMSLMKVGGKQGVTVHIPYPEVISGTPEEAGINTSVLDIVDSIIENDIENGFTSAQLVILKDGKIVKSSAYGVVNSYNQDGTPIENGIPATTDTLYDLASNTKMYATNYAIQKLVTNDLISINDKIDKFFPEFSNQEGDNEQVKAWKAKLTIKDILQHQAGFPADPQYHNNKFNQETQKPDPNANNPLFSQDKETTKSKVLATQLIYEPGTKTVYSDVDYMLLGLVIEKVTGKDLDSYIRETFVDPMGLTHVTYNPLNNGFSKDEIAATELNGNTRDGVIDFENIRTYTLQGEVHDEKAYYAMNGISGHAGLFSNAEDLAKLCQIMLNDGGYGNNDRFFSQNVGEYFASRKDSMPTWGQGWWRQGDNGRPWYFGVQSSRNTIGHQGWTGTLTMIDPVDNIVVVLLTNKINSPVTNTEVNANKFDGNWYTSATLGFVANILYQGLEDRNSGDIDQALDALLADMATDKLRLVKAQQMNDKDTNTPLNPKHPIVRSAYSIVQTLLDRAEERGTSQIEAYANKALSHYNAIVAGLTEDKVASILSSSSPEFSVGDDETAPRQEITVVIAPETASDKTLVWTVSGTNAEKFELYDEPTGGTAVPWGTALPNTTVYLGIKNGETIAPSTDDIITATANDGSEIKADITVTIGNALPDIESISIGFSNLGTMRVGTSQQLTATISPAEAAASATLTWSSSNESILTVDTEGIVKALAIGSARITVTAPNGISHTIIIRVTA